MDGADQAEQYRGGRLVDPPATPVRSQNIEVDLIARYVERMLGAGNH